MIHPRRVASAAAAALALGACGAEVGAQGTSAPVGEVRVELAADPGRRGPAALTWIRGRVLPTLPTWQRGCDPFGPLEVRLSHRGVEVEPAASGTLGDRYLRATVGVAGVGTLRVRGGFDGLEVWEGSELRPPKGRLHDLLELIGLERHSGPLMLDVGALVGGWLPGLDHTDPLAALLSVGPAECGQLTLLIDRRDEDLCVVGRSHGGVLLPALLWVLADLKARPGTELRPITDADPWILLARSACDAEREEAARQLVLCSDSIAQDALERLLLADDFTRVVAMDALVRRRCLDSLERVVDAATPAIGGTEELAEVALQSLLPRTPRARRDRILEGLPRHASPLLRAFGARWREPAAPPLSAARWVALLALGFSAVAILVWLGVRGVQRRVVL